MALLLWSGACTSLVALISTSSCSAIAMVSVKRSLHSGSWSVKAPVFVYATALFILAAFTLSLLQPTEPVAWVSSPVTTPRRLEFVHITKCGGSAIEKAGAGMGIIWGACHYMNISDLGCENPDLPYLAPNFQSYALTSPWHTPPKILKTQQTPSPYADGADLFAVVRNPYDRVVSEYYCPWTGFQPKFRRRNTKHDKDPNDPNTMNYWVKNMVTKLEQSLNEYASTSPKDRLKEQARGVNEDPFDLAQKHYVNQVEYIFDGEEIVVKNIVHYEDLTKEFDLLMREYGLNVHIPPKESGGTYTNSQKKLTYRDLNEESIAAINKYAAKDFELLGYKKVDRFRPDDNYSLRAE